MANTSKVEIVNFKQVLAHLRNLDMTNKGNVKKVRKFLKTPFATMRKAARKNLSGQNSSNTGDPLYKGLRVSGKFKKNKGYFSAAFGGAGKSREGDGSTNHFHLVNSGTKKRYHKNFKSVGAVGDSRTDYKNKNKSFKLGFADRAISPNIPTASYLTANFKKVVLQTKTNGV